MHESFSPAITRAIVKIKHHFMQPGAQRSEDASGACKYRKDETPECPIRCALGVLIPDDKYSDVYEGSTLVHEDIRALAKELGFSGSHDCGFTGDFRILNKLQDFHDQSNSVERLLEKINLFCEDPESF